MLCMSTGIGTLFIPPELMQIIEGHQFAHLRIMTIMGHDFSKQIGDLQLRLNVRDCNSFIFIMFTNEMVSTSIYILFVRQILDLP